MLPYEAVARRSTVRLEMLDGESATCRRCGSAIATDARVIRAFDRIVVAPTDDATPDLRGSAAPFHLDCGPAWGDPAWVSRTEGLLVELESQVEAPW